MARICTNCGLETYSSDSTCEHCGKPFEVKQLRELASNGALE